MKKVVLFFIFLLLLISVIFLFASNSYKKKVPTVTINGKKFSVEIADDETKRGLGLGRRESLCKECGMLFLFPEAGNHSFWMKEMKFSIDIIWIADSPPHQFDCQANQISFFEHIKNFLTKENWLPQNWCGGKIVHIEKNIPRNFSGAMNPLKKADKALEINAGIADGLGIKPGDEIRIENIPGH